MAEPELIKCPFGVSNHVLDQGLNTLKEGALLGGHVPDTAWVIKASSFCMYWTQPVAHNRVMLEN